MQRVHLMRPLLVAVSVMILTPAVAYAQPAARGRDRLGATMDATFGGGLHTGEVSDHASRPAPVMRVGGGICRGRHAGILSFSTGMLAGLDESGAPIDFLELSLEPSLRYELTRGAGWRVHVRGGWRWRWLLGDGDLPRTCTVNGGCTAGYYVDSPTYAAHGPTVAIGVGGRTRGDTWGAFGLELGIGHAIIRRPGTNPDLGDTMVSLGLNIALGRGNP